ncbi:unnamed protein product [Rhodiola kirilowii]
MNEAWEEPEKPYIQRVFEALEAASVEFPKKQIVSRDLSSNSAIKALLEVDEKNSDPILLKLAQLLTDLISTINKLRKHQGYSITDFVRRRLISYQVSRLVGSIEDVIGSWVDREVVLHLTQTIEQSDSETAKLEALNYFEKRVSRGFNRELQDLILRSKIFHMLEDLLSDTNAETRVREQSGAAIAAVVEFNRDVFVGLALMGPTATTLVSISSPKSIQTLSKLIRLIKSPLVDELESRDEIPKIISLFLRPPDASTRLTAFECVLEVAYFARKEVIDSMLEMGVVEKLVELQRTEWSPEAENIVLGKEEEVFERCVARFAVQLEVGERLGRKERRELKVEIMRRVRESCVTEAEAATILAEVLWGSSP